MVGVVVAIAVGLPAWQVGAELAAPEASLAVPGAKPFPKPGVASTLPDLGRLPAVNIGEPRPYPVSEKSGNKVYAGTAGLTLPVPENRSGTTFAILGDRTAGADWGIKYLRRSVEELNQLRPDLVLSVGDLVQGYTRSEEVYAREAGEVRGVLDQLVMPWYAAVGNHDVIPGTSNPQDRRFEALWQKYFGPLYYSIDYNDLHFIMLDSEEQLASLPVLSEAQLKWLKQDLDRTFENPKIAHVFVVIHKPMWRYEKSNWAKVHELLAEFNRRPVVEIEGAKRTVPVPVVEGKRVSTPPVGLHHPARVEGVFAGHLHTYIKDPAKDGIGYYVLAVTGGQIDQDALTGQMQSYMLVKVDAQGPHLSLLEPFTIHADDFVGAADRAIVDLIGKFDEQTMGIDGSMEQPVGKAVGSKESREHPLMVRLANPLDLPLDIRIRMASAKNLVTANQRETANPYVESYDSPWDMVAPLVSRHLLPGEKVNFQANMFCPAQPGETMPPQVEFVLSWVDSKGRTVSTVIKRRVPLVPSLDIPVNTRSGTPSAEEWTTAAQGGTYSQVPSYYDLPVPSPKFKILADDQNVYVRVQVEDTQPSYFADFSQPSNLRADALAIAFAPSPETDPALVQRIVVLPFAPGVGEVGGGSGKPGAYQPQLLTNSGLGKTQTDLLPLDLNKYSVKATVNLTGKSYDLVVTLPRDLVLPAGGEAEGGGGVGVWNVTVTSNDHSAHSTTRSWAREDLGPKVWGRVKIKAAESR